MSEQTHESASVPLSLPESPNLDWLRKEAKRRLEQIRSANPGAALAEAQFQLAKQYGFPSWRALKAHIDSLTVDGQLIEAARKGNVDDLAAMLDKHREKLHLRIPPYEWTLLHTAAHHGHLAVVDLLLRRGLEVNVRERGDNTYAMHWAAAAGHLDVVRRLADAGGDVVGHGDDHELEVIGWATGWAEPDGAHRAVADFLVSRGARHHIFSAIAANLPDEVRRIVAEDPSALSRRMSRNENHQTPLHFAVKRKRVPMVALLLELGADPLAVDGFGFPVVVYATEPDIDRPVMEKICSMLIAELDSAVRGQREPRIQTIDLAAALVLGKRELAGQIVGRNPDVVNRGVLHMMSKRGDVAAAKWLLDHGADPNAQWAHWDSEVTPLHLAILGDHASMVSVLLQAGADPTIRESKHNGDALGWGEFFGRSEIVRILRNEVKS
jgi:ankyrin repeat protein